MRAILRQWGSLFFCVLLLAQSDLAFAQRKVLLLTKAQSGDIDRLREVVMKHYAGSVEQSEILPDDLEGYEAILLLHEDRESGLLDSLDQLRVVEYLSSGGRLYAEGSTFRNEVFPPWDDRSNPLWDFVGDSLEAWSSSVVLIDSVVGLPNSFANGLDFFHKAATNGDAMEGFHIYPMASVLETRGHTSVRLAWVAEPPVRAVLHWPAVREHYEKFLGLLLCDYFGLCVLSSDSPHTGAQSFIHFESTTRKVLAAQLGTIRVQNLLGQCVFEERSCRSVTLDRSLPPGVYLVEFSNAISSAEDQSFGRNGPRQSLKILLQ